MLLYLLATTAVLLSSATLAARWFGKTPLLALLALLVLVLTQITGIQLVLGALGQLYPIAVTTGAIALCISLLLFLSRNLTAIDVLDSEKPQLNLLGWGSLGLIGLVMAQPIVPMVSDLLYQLQKVHPLGWDVVSYHLPNVVDYIQAHSLWSLTGSYAYYPGGNELLNLWSMGPLRHEGAIGLTTLTLELGIALTIGLLARSLLPNLHPFFQGLVALVTLAVCLYVPPLQGMLFDLGRNDITIAFWQVLALWLLLQLDGDGSAVRSAVLKNDPPKSPFKRGTLSLFLVPPFLRGVRGDRPSDYFWQLSLGVCTGMLIGIKPNGAFLALALWGMVGVKQPRSLPRIILPALAIGGFWYLRNLIAFGRLSPPNQLAGAMDLSIATNLLNPQLYTLNAPLLWLIGGLVISITTLLAKPTVPMKLVATWILVSILGLMLTPSGAGYFMGSGKTFLIQLRYGAAIVPFTVLLLASWLNGFDRLSMPSFLNKFTALNHRPSSKFALTIAPLILTTLTLLTTTYKPPLGLPAYEGIFFPFGKTPSGLYAWVQENLRDRTIFSVGPRPLGLYGPNWSNRVIARLGATHIPEIPADATDLVITYDPFTRKLPDNLGPIANQSNLRIIYQDKLSIVLHRTTEPMQKN
jgi:hypothetical protein